MFHKYTVFAIKKYNMIYEIFVPFSEQFPSRYEYGYGFSFLESESFYLIFRDERQCDPSTQPCQTPTCVPPCAVEARSSKQCRLLQVPVHRIQ